MTDRKAKARAGLAFVASHPSQVRRRMGIRRIEYLSGSILDPMLTSAERLYDRLKSRKAIQALVGLPEDADFDCKEWTSRQDAARGTIAKAACGFSNATGGVIVIGLTAKGQGSGLPDVVNGLAPVSDRKAVAADALDIILKFVEPGIEGVKVRTIPNDGSKPSGYVVIFVPACDGSPRRSKVDWRFYVRIASGTLPMEFFQVEDRFGKRPFPKLSLYLEIHPIMERHGLIDSPLRLLVFGLKNEGRGIAKFPGIRFKRSNGLRREDFGIDGNAGFGLPPRASEYSWIVFRGGVDDVIYPGETRLIGKLLQTAVHKGDTGIAPHETPVVRYVTAERLWVCEAILLEYEISAEGIATQSLEHNLGEDSLTLRIQVR